MVGEAVYGRGKVDRGIDGRGNNGRGNNARGNNDRGKVIVPFYPLHTITVNKRSIKSILTGTVRDDLHDCKIRFQK